MIAYVVQIQGIDQIGHVGTSPRNHLVSLNTLVPTSREPLLHEQDLRVVIGPLGKDAVAASPGGDHIERHAET
jgi:hypothetical protein